MKQRYEFVEPFDIDDGQLDDLSPQMCFALGVEWQMVRSQIAGGEGFSGPLHAENRERIEAMLRRNGRTFTLKHMHDDRSESWMNLTVDPKEES